MGDSLVVGHTFDGATGLKTGAELEDLVAQAQFATDTPILDQETLEDFDNAGTRAARVKDGGITLDKLAPGVLLSTNIITSGMISNGGGWDSGKPADLANMADGNAATATGAGTRAGNDSAFIEVDLGAPMTGIFRLVYKMWISGSSTEVNLWVASKDNKSYENGRVGGFYHDTNRNSAAAAVVATGCGLFTGQVMQIGFDGNEPSSGGTCMFYELYFYKLSV